MVWYEYRRFGRTYCLRVQESSVVRFLLVYKKLPSKFSAYLLRPFVNSRHVSCSKSRSSQFHSSSMLLPILGNLNFRGLSDDRRQNLLRKWADSEIKGGHTFNTHTHTHTHTHMRASAKCRSNNLIYFLLTLKYQWSLYVPPV